MEITSLRHRDELPEWLNRAGLKGLGVEVGVFEGDYSWLLLHKWAGASLIGVDPYKNFPDEVYRDGCNQTNLENIGVRAAQRFATFKRYKLMMKASLEAVKQFQDFTCDFVYIDSNHSYDSASADIRAWWPKVKSGGIVGGHDFYHRDDDAQRADTARAVYEFAYSIQCPFWVTSCTSWWMHKP